jgi:DNA-directed RNA polymerase specialized sigma24 family protein
LRAERIAAEVPLEMLLPLVLNGDRNAVAELIRRYSGTIRHRIVRTLYEWNVVQRQRGVLNYVDDLVQEVWVSVFADRARLLREWDPSVATLEALLAVVAQRRAADLLRSKKRSPLTEKPTEHEDLNLLSEKAVDPEEPTFPPQALADLEMELARSGSPRDIRLYNSILKEESVEDICRREKMTRDAVYAWKMRFINRARGWLSKLSKDDA